MFRKIVETVVGGALGLAALYAVAKVAFSAGQEMADMERRYHDLGGAKVDVRVLEGTQTDAKDTHETASTAKTNGKLGVLFGLKRMLGKSKPSVVKDLMSDPEDHKLEAYIDEGEVHINIKKRTQRGGAIHV